MRTPIWFFTLAFLTLLGCTSAPPPAKETEYSRVFNAPFDVVWRATQQALLNYPMNINNMDTGFLQTLYITGKHRYLPPHREKETLSSGYQYRLNVNIQKGETRTKVSIAKEVRIQVDFFSDPKDGTSDGYEEKALLYRILREIAIENVIKKNLPANTQANPS